MFNVSGYSAEDSTVKSRPDPNRPGRTIEATVKSKPDPRKPGRTLEQTAGIRGTEPYPIS